jgi:DHA2 family methylenomycin A resistance protein-like MFS transporter
VTVAGRRDDDSTTRAALPGRLGYLGVLLGVFVIVLDTTIVNVAVPAIQHDLHSTVTGVQWVVNGYNLVFAALLLSAGAAADRLGGRRVFGCGLVLFAIASLSCGLAPTLPLLITARAVQGLGAALMLPTALSLAAHLHPEQRARARAFGQWAAVAGAATVLGPLVGGTFVDTLGWRAIFFVNVPIAATALALLIRNAPETERHGHRLDPAGQALSVVLLAAAAVTLTEAGHVGWVHPATLIAAAVTLAATAGLGLAEHRAAAPMIPPALMRQPQFAATSLIGLLLSVGIYGQMFVLSLYFQDARGYSAWLTGLAFLPFAATTTIGPLIASRVLARNRVRAVLLAGQTAGIAASLLLALVDQHTTYWVVAVALLVLGVCQSLCQPAVATAALMQAPDRHAGIASGVLTATRQVGSVLGVALLGGLVSTPGTFIPGMHTALLIVTALFAVGTALAATTIRHPRSQR